LDQDLSAILTQSIDTFLYAAIVSSPIAGHRDRMPGPTGRRKRPRLFVVEGLALGMDHWPIRERDESSLAGKWSCHLGVARRCRRANIFSIERKIYTFRPHGQPGMTDVHTLGRDVIHKDPIQADRQKMFGIEPEQVYFSGRDVMDRMQHDAFILWNQTAGGRRIERGEQQRVFYLPHAYTFIGNVADQPSPALVGLDANSVVGAVN